MIRSANMNVLTLLIAMTVAIPLTQMRRKVDFGHTRKGGEAKMRRTYQLPLIYH
jgi:hypothetical protein